MSTIRGWYGVSPPISAKLRGLLSASGQQFMDSVDGLLRGALGQVWVTQNEEGAHLHESAYPGEDCSAGESGFPLRYQPQRRWEGAGAELVRGLSRIPGGVCSEVPGEPGGSTVILWTQVT